MLPPEKPQSESGSTFVSEPETTTVASRGRGDSLTRRVLETVSRATGRDPLDMEPLYESIDPDALERLFEPNDSETRQSVPALVRFHFEGCVVSVYPTGRIVVVAPESA